jgi:hypothetical protein
VRRKPFLKITGINAVFVSVVLSSQCRSPKQSSVVIRLYCSAVFSELLRYPRSINQLFKDLLPQHQFSMSCSYFASSSLPCLHSPFIHPPHLNARYAYSVCCRCRPCSVGIFLREVEPRQLSRGPALGKFAIFTCVFLAGRDFRAWTLGCGARTSHPGSPVAGGSQRFGPSATPGPGLHCAGTRKAPQRLMPLGDCRDEVLSLHPLRSLSSQFVAFLLSRGGFYQ